MTRHPDYDGKLLTTQARLERKEPVEHTPVPLNRVELSSAWEALGAYQDCIPPPLNKCRFLFAGRSKTGKTSFMCGMPGALLIDMEGGAHSVPHKQATVVYCPVRTERELTPQMKAGLVEGDTVVRPPATCLHTVMDLLERDARGGNPTFSHVIFDSAEILQEMVLTEMSEEIAKKTSNKWTDARDYKGGMGGWALINARSLSYPRRLYSVGYAWTLITHIKVEEDEKTKVRYDRPSITKGFYGGAGLDAEYLLEIIRDEGSWDPVTKSKRVRYTITTQASNAGNPDFRQGGRVTLAPRLDDIPLESGFQCLEEAYRVAIENLRYPGAPNTKE